MDYARLIIELLLIAAALVVGRWFWRKSFSGHDSVITHLRVTGKDATVTLSDGSIVDYETWRRQRLAEAAAKYGKPFKCADGKLDLKHDQVHRVEPPSRDLDEIEKATRAARAGEKLIRQIEAETNVTTFGKKARSTNNEQRAAASQ